MLINSIKHLLSFFWRLHNNSVKKNIIFKNSHQGECCAIFGNGPNLRLFDFKNSKLEMKKIGINWSYLHQHFYKNYFDYYIIPDTYNLYKLIKNNYNHKIQKNYRSKIWKQFICNNQQTVFFCNLSNFYATRNFKNMYYLTNHFTKFNKNSFNQKFDMDRDFDYTTSSLENSIGVAKYMGFKSIYLLGFDYLSTPKNEGHFYSSYKIIQGKPATKEYIDRIVNATRNIEINLVLPKGYYSNFFNSVSIEEFTKNKQLIDLQKNFFNTKYLYLYKKAKSYNQIF